MDAIASSSENLLGIVNEILDLSKIEAGSMALEKVPMDATCCGARVMEVMRYRAEEKGLKLDVDRTGCAGTWYRRCHALATGVDEPGGERHQIHGAWIGAVSRSM